MALTRLQQLTELIENILGHVSRARTISDALSPLIQSGPERRAMGEICNTIIAIDQEARGAREVLRQKQAGKRRKKNQVIGK